MYQGDVVAELDGATATAEQVGWFMAGGGEAGHDGATGEGPDE
jgi:hypothetical protein